MPRHSSEPWLVRGIGPVRIRFRRRTVVVAALLLTTVLAVSLVALIAGEPTVWPADVFSGTLSPGRSFVLRELRAPRVLCGLIAGFAFGVGGSLFQNLTRNPLGSPDVLGIIAGASTGALVALTAGHGSTSITALAALTGAAAVAVPLSLLATLGRVGLGSVILAGMGVALLLNAVNAWLVLRASPEVGYQAGRWLLGTLEFSSWYQVPRAGIALIVVTAVFIVNLRMLPLLGFSDEQNTTVGANVRAMNARLIGFGLVFVAIGVWTTGPLTLLAFFAPQVAQRLAGTPVPPLYLSGLVGSATLVVADAVGRLLLPRAGIPVGSVVIVLGGSYLLWLLLIRPQYLVR